MLTRIAALLLLLLFPFVSSALVTVDNDLEIVLIGESNPYTLKSASQFDELSITSTQFSFSLSQGGRFTITSADKKGLSNSLNVNASCSDSESSLAINDSHFSASSVTVKVTPSGTCAGGGGGPVGNGGGGGGGGGGGAVAAPSALAPAKVAEAKIAPALVPAPAAVFTKTIRFRSRGEDVTRLQALLARDKEIYPEALVTGFYGSLTREAVKRFQKKYGLSQVGQVGPLTRKKLGEVFGVVPPPAPAPVPIAPPPSGPTSAQIQAIRDQIDALRIKLLQEQMKLIQEKINQLKK